VGCLSFDVLFLAVSYLYYIWKTQSQFPSLILLSFSYPDPTHLSNRRLWETLSTAFNFPWFPAGKCYDWLICTFYIGLQMKSTASFFVISLSYIIIFIFHHFVFYLGNDEGSLCCWLKFVERIQRNLILSVRCINNMDSFDISLYFEDDDIRTRNPWVEKLWVKASLL
jgi:hypothetical protein